MPWRFPAPQIFFVCKFEHQWPAGTIVDSVLRGFTIGPSKATVTQNMPPKRTKRPVVASNFDEDSHLPDRGQVIEKDETEAKLEKLIFGDEAGFLGSLKADASGQELLRISNLSDEEGEHTGNDEDFHGVADEDVRSASILRNRLSPKLTDCIAFLPRLFWTWHGTCGLRCRPAVKQWRHTRKRRKTHSLG
jgi:hypothetical protein